MNNDQEVPNQPLEVPNGVPFVITQEDFIQATQAWRIKVQENTDLTQYFQKGLQLVAGYSFRLDDIEKLVSSLGIESVMVRFGIRHDPTSGSDLFTVILYGFNNFKMRITPYLVGTPFLQPKTEKAADGPVPLDLADKWVDNWLEQTTIEQTYFDTPYGKLQGYNYNYNDFLDTLFGASVDSKQPLQVNFALHKYYPADATDRDHTISTFGLVLDLAQSQDTTDPPPKYFDFSAPCPPTC